MSLIKKIIACSLAMSMSLGGVHATPAKISELANKPITKNQLIGGSCTLLGTGALIGTVIGVWRHYANKMPVLVIGKNKEDRTKLIDSIKNNTDCVSDNICATFNSVGCQRPVTGIDAKEARVKNWNIRQCGVDDANLESLVQKSKLVLVISDSQVTVNQLHNKFERIPDLFSRGIISIETAPGIPYPNQTHGIQGFRLLNYYGKIYWDKTNQTFNYYLGGPQGVFNMIRAVRDPLSRLPDQRRQKEAKMNKAWNDWIRDNPKPKV